MVKLRRKKPEVFRKVGSFIPITVGAELCVSELKCAAVGKKIMLLFEGLVLLFIRR